MSEIDDALRQLRQLFGQEAAARAQRKALMDNWGIDRERQEVEDRALSQQLEECERRSKERLHEILTFPREHIRSPDKLEAFRAVAGFEKSVFIMTKFPGDNRAEQTDLDRQLVKVIDAVRNAITNAGFTPRVGSDQQFHPLLWDNVVLYMLGCIKGVAIVEDKYKDEFNPNVAMEWGWMRGMRRDVLYLVERDFDSARADTSGYISKQFIWADPEADIQREVGAWLNPGN